MATPRTGPPLRRARAEDYGTLVQHVDPGPYRGKRLKFSGFLKSHEVEGWCGLWVRVDSTARGDGQRLDNMQDRPVEGTSDWRLAELVVDVPKQATNISFGALLVGTGTMWIDDLSFDVVDSTIATTARQLPAGPLARRFVRRQPTTMPARNLDFELAR